MCLLVSSTCAAYINKSRSNVVVCFLLCNICPSLLSASHLTGGGNHCDERNIIDLNTIILHDENTLLMLGVHILGEF